MTKAHDPNRLYSITELAHELGITPRTIRFYEAKELLTPRRAGNTRVYSHRDRARLLIILRGKRLGFSLEGIRTYLELYDADPAHHEQLRLLLCGVRERIDLLESQRIDLELTLDELREIEDQTLKAMAAAEEPADEPADPATD